MEMVGWYKAYRGEFPYSDLVERTKGRESVSSGLENYRLLSILGNELKIK